MILINDVIVNDSVIEQQFVCDLNACKGACCVEGESGAPLDVDELETLEKIYPLVKKYLSDEGISAIENRGFFVKDVRGRYKTPLMKNGACAYVHYENGIAGCGIQKAFHAGEVDFQKPISCHLYPIRITKSRTGKEHLNYEEWEVCAAACVLGKQKKMPVYQFVKDALIRKYGAEFFEILEEAAGYKIK